MYHYKGCGLPNVWLVNGFTERDTPYGPAVAIADIDGLHRVIGLEIIEKPGRFSPEEVRFLRKEMDLSQKMLAECLQLKEVTVRNWERKDRPKGGCPKGPAQLLLRMLYLEYTGGDGQVREMVERLSNLDQASCQLQLRFKDSPEIGWRRESLAA